MKKLIIRSLLVLSITASTICGGNMNLFNINNTAVATASAIDNIIESKPTLDVYSRTATTVNLNIGKVIGAVGYKIYRASTKDGQYNYIGSTKTGSYKDTDLKDTNSYYYRVRAYKYVDETKVHSKYSNQVSVIPTFSKTKDIKAQAKYNQAITVTWTNVNGATSHKVYHASSENETYIYIGYSYSNSYEDIDLISGKTYYYHVRAYKMIDGVKYNGVYSEKVSATTTKNISSNDYYASQVLKLVNQERAKEDLSELKMDQSLMNPAHKRAVEIVDLFSHTRPDGTPWSSVLEDYNITFQTAGENLAYGYNTPVSVVNGWMNSPGHRANIMNSKYGKILK